MKKAPLTSTDVFIGGLLGFVNGCIVGLIIGLGLSL